MVTRLGVVACSFVIAAQALAQPDPMSEPQKERPLYYEREIKPADLEGRTLRELSLMRNWIYARAGNQFRKKWLHDFFSSYDWYEPTGLDMSKVPERDRENAKIINDYELSLPQDSLEKQYRELYEKHRNADVQAVNALALSPDGKKLLTGAWDRVILWDLATGKREREWLSREWTISPEPEDVARVAFSADGKQVFVGTIDGRMMAFDRATGKRQWYFHAFEKYDEPYDWVLSPNGNAFIGFYEYAMVVRGSDQKVLSRFKGEDWEMDPNSVAEDGSAGIVRNSTVEAPFFLDLTRRKARPEKIQRGDLPDLFWGEVATDGKRIYGVVGKTFYELFTDKPPVKLGTVDIKDKDPEKPSGIRALRITGGGKLLFAEMPGTAIILFDLAHKKTVFTHIYNPPGRSGSDPLDDLVAVVFTPDGKRAIAGGYLGFIPMDAKTGKRPTHPATSFPGVEPWPDDETRIEASLLARSLGKVDFAMPAADRSPLDDVSLLDEVITLEQLSDLSRRDLRLLRNTIFARRGRPYKSPTLQEYFDRMEWYKPDDGYTDARLTAIDRRNIQIVLSLEKRLGGPLTEEQVQEAEFMSGA